MEDKCSMIVDGGSVVYSTQSYCCVGTQSGTADAGWHSGTPPTLTPLLSCLDCVPCLCRFGSLLDLASLPVPAVVFDDRHCSLVSASLALIYFHPLSCDP